MPSPPGSCPRRLSHGGGAAARSEFVATPGGSPATLSEARIIATTATRKQRGTMLMRSSLPFEIRIFKQVDGLSIIVSIAAPRRQSAAGTKQGSIGLHAGDGGMQHRLEGRTEGGRGVVDRDGRTTLGPVRPRPEPGELPPGPPAAESPLVVECQPLVAGSGMLGLVGPMPARQHTALATGQLDLRGQGLERRVEDP